MTRNDDLVPHMRRVQQGERDMRELSLLWQMIESSSAISCPEEVAPLLPTLRHTRSRFELLQSRLVGQLVDESREQVADELSAKAQCAIDILVRNLYERTADVGFLAVDDTVRNFCAHADARSDADRKAMGDRLAQYRSKYTVYDDVILLSTSGEILARLQSESGDGVCRDAFVAAVPQRDGYHEVYGPSSLADNNAAALLYAHRVMSSTNAVVGILVLRFRLGDELDRIFDGMADERGQVALVLLDAGQRVVASNDPAHVPIGAKLRAVPDNESSLTTFGGREYLAVACPAHAYQGYGGPGWRAQAMMSLLTAFVGREEAASDTSGDVEVALDNDELNTIQGDADGINRELRRVVWNGQLMARRQDGDSHRLKAVLSEVSAAGHRTRERVSLAIRDLYRTSMSRGRQQAQQLARLAADILDRNLYERANDCRWWALSPSLKSLLTSPASSAQAAKIGSLLDHINGLYTVYSRLVVFDDAGVVRGVSRASGAPQAVGSKVPGHWLTATQQLQGSQHYAVSPFEDTEFHDAGQTYTYLAAITHPATPTTRLGGIGIVFNSRAELGAMLRDVAGSRNGFAAFVGPDGEVLATSLDTIDAAALKTVPPSTETIVEHQGAHYVMARVAGGGYREFKTSDGYQNGVDVVVGLRLGPVERRRTSLAERALVSSVVRNREQRLELAVFQVGPGRYALPASVVLQALPKEGIVRTPGQTPWAIGLQEVATEHGPVLVRVVCARELFGLNYAPRASDGIVVILASPHAPRRPALGLRVDDVMGITEVAKSAWQTSPMQGGGAFGGGRILGIVDCPLSDLSEGSAALAGAAAIHDQRSRALVQVLDVQSILDILLPAASRQADAGSRLSGLDAIEAVIAADR